MTTVNSTTATTTGTSAAGAGKSASALGKDEFLKMLVAQLKNQSPLNPMDGTDFAAQLAQFSTVEQVMNMASRMGAMADSISAMNNAQMSNLIGNEATVQTNKFRVDGARSTLTYDLAAATQKGTVKIYNSSGIPVKTINLGSQSAGANTLNWDSSGLDSGTYTFDVSATDKNGTAVKTTTMMTGTITGISYKDGTPYITVNGQDTAFSSVISMKKQATTI